MSALEEVTEPRDEQGEAMEPTEKGKGRGDNKQDEGPHQVQLRSGVSEPPPSLVIRASSFVAAEADSFVWGEKNLSTAPLFQSTFLTPRLSTSASADKVTHPLPHPLHGTVSCLKTRTTCILTVGPEQPRCLLLLGVRHTQALKLAQSSGQVATGFLGGREGVG